MTKNQNDLIIEYAFSPSADAEDRLVRGYDLILETVITEAQNPEEDGADALPDALTQGPYPFQPRCTIRSVRGKSRE